MGGLLFLYYFQQRVGKTHHRTGIQAGAGNAGILNKGKEGAVNKRHSIE